MISEKNDISPWFGRSLFLSFRLFLKNEVTSFEFQWDELRCRSSASIEMCNKQSDRKKGNLVKREHHKISFSSGGVVVDGWRREAAGGEKVLSIIHIIIRLRSRTWIKRIISLSFLFVWDFFLLLSPPANLSRCCCRWLVVSVAGSVALYAADISSIFAKTPLSQILSFRQESLA